MYKLKSTFNKNDVKEYHIDVRKNLLEYLKIFFS